MKGWTTLFLLAASIAVAQRAKPVIDPETREGFLLAHIQQEEDSAQKLQYLEQFAKDYPKHPAAAWVYDQLQPAYLRSSNWAAAIRIGELRLSIEPENFEAAKITLRAADCAHDSDLVRNWADRTWDIAAMVIAHGGREAADALQTQKFAEYTLYSSAIQTPDPKERLALLQSFEQRHPESQYASGLAADYFYLYMRIGEPGKALSQAEKILASDPDNVDVLGAVADYHFKAMNSLEKVLAYSVRMIEVLQTKAQPEATAEEDWNKRKAQILGSANYMGGISSFVLGQYAKSDAMLRLALPAVAKDEAAAGTALYYLGVANYKLAAAGQAGRAVDALQFTRRCAGLRSSYQTQAVKNIESIRSEFNLP